MKMSSNRAWSVCLAVVALSGSAAAFVGSTVLDIDEVRAAIPVSSGTYRMPYAAGTRVFVSHDVYSHDPEGRLDLRGTDGASYRIVAAAPGTVMAIEDDYSANRPDMSPCNNNFVWIRHANGEWTKYTHMKQDSVTVDADLAVGDTVRAGQFLGIQSNVGCAHGSHLHFEVAVPPTGVTNPVTVSGDMPNRINRNPKICRLPPKVSGTLWNLTWLRNWFLQDDMTVTSHQSFYQAPTMSWECPDGIR